MCHSFVGKLVISGLHPEDGGSMFVESRGYRSFLRIAAGILPVCSTLPSARVFILI